MWHLVSKVRGRLRPGVGNEELLRATFPPGSVTGAPKVQAMRVIAELEPTGREVYTGAVGFASPVAGLELNVAIRTFEHGRRPPVAGRRRRDRRRFRSEHEFEEALVKASPLVAAIGSGSILRRGKAGSKIRQDPAQIDGVACNVVGGRQ